MKNIKKFTSCLSLAAIIAFNSFAFPVWAADDTAWQPPDESIKWEMEEFPMTFHYLPGEPQNYVNYLNAIEQPEGILTEFTGVLLVKGTAGSYSYAFSDQPDYLYSHSESALGTYVKRKDNPMTAEEAKALGEQLLQEQKISSYQLVWRRVAETTEDVLSYFEESGAVWITPPDGLPDYVQFALKEFPMSFNFMPGEPNNSIYYEHAIEQPEDCKTEFTGVIHVTGVYDIFAGVFYNMPDYLSTASECEWGTYAKRKDNPMTAEEAKALGEQLLQDGKIKSYQLVWRRIAETKDADINSDGSVAADDAQMVLREYVNVLALKAPGFSKQQKLLADVTNDNLIDAKDALQILKYYVDTLAEK